MVATCYTAFVWASNEGYDVMKSFFLGLGSAVGNFAALALLFLGTCFPSNSISVNRIRHIHSITFEKKSNDGKTTDIHQNNFGVACDNLSKRNFSHNPVCVSDYI